MEASARSAPTKNKAFWKNHVELQKSNDLSRADYCRQNNLNYHSFGYWLKKWPPYERQESSRLIAIKIKPDSEVQTQATLCTLTLNNGRCLKIHDLQSLALILEKLR